MISIIIPVYNRKKLIVSAIESILHQTSKEWELIIVDDLSTDGTWNKISQYASDSKGRIKVHQRNREPKGAPTCRNIGLELAKSDYVLFLDSDDILAPWCIETRNNLISTKSTLR